MEAIMAQVITLEVLLTNSALANFLANAEAGACIFPTKGGTGVRSRSGFPAEITPYGVISKDRMVLPGVSVEEVKSFLKEIRRMEVEKKENLNLQNPALQAATKNKEDLTVLANAVINLHGQVATIFNGQIFVAQKTGNEYADRFLGGDTGQEGLRQQVEEAAKAAAQHVRELADILRRVEAIYRLQSSESWWTLEFELPGRGPVKASEYRMGGRPSIVEEALRLSGRKVENGLPPWGVHCKQLLWS